MANNCSICGKNLDLVGGVHNCVPLQTIGQNLPGHGKETGPSKKPGENKPKRRVTKGSSYQYRDPEKRKAYMRSYMAKRRASSDR